MELAPDRPNVELRRDRDGQQTVVLAFPYDRALVELARSIPHRRFDWDSKEWSAPASDWAALKVTELLARHPELETGDGVREWLRGVAARWIGRVSTVRHPGDGTGRLVLHTLAGPLPGPIAAVATPADARDAPADARDAPADARDAPGGSSAPADLRDDPDARGDPLGPTAADHAGDVLAPLTPEVARALRAERSAMLDAAAERCLQAIEHGEAPPAAQLALHRGVEGPELRLEVGFDPAIGRAFEALPAADGSRALALDPWIVDQLEAFLAAHEVTVTGLAAEALHEVRAEHAAAADAIASSRADGAPPIEGVADRLGGELAPFQWAGVRYALNARATFVADEQGLGKTVEALAALEAADAFPAVVVCPAAMKLTWEREAAKWLPHRSTAVVSGRVAVPPRGEITILNYEIVAAHRESLARRRPRAIVVDEAHYCKNPSAKRTQAVRALAGAVHRDGLKLALTGTPVLNHPDELIAQLRVIDRLRDFGSGARFSHQFRGRLMEERLHWHLRRRCFVRRLKADVLPQLPAKRQVVVPIALTNEPEYRLAQRDVIEWLRTQPLDLSELNAKISATLRAERLAQLGTLQRLAARGKLAAALAWIEDFLASGEALVVFARHVEVQKAVVERFGDDALHLLGEDPLPTRERAIERFQDPAGPRLIVCATRTAAQGITLTRASNVAFLELEWTPAIHDQAEDRCHRIGQRDAVTAWYLLAADTIDETMSRLIESKRATVAAVTDGRVIESGSLIDAVVAELRDGRPFSHLRAVVGGQAESG